VSLDRSTFESSYKLQGEEHPQLPVPEVSWWHSNSEGPGEAHSPWVEIKSTEVEEPGAKSNLNSAFSFKTSSVMG
jgi:hypothetical protein